MLRDGDLYFFVLGSLSIPWIYCIKQDWSIDTIIIGYVFLILLFLSSILRHKNAFKYNKTDLIVFNSWFGYTKSRIQIKDIVSIWMGLMIVGRGISPAVAIEIYNKKTKYYCCRSLNDDQIKAMISVINKYILSYITENNKKQNYNENFRCKKIHIKPEKAIYGRYIFFFYFVLYIVVAVVWWNSMINLYDGGFLFFYLLVGILLPILIYKSKMQKTAHNAHNVYLNDCLITITNESNKYRKIIPFESIKNIEYKSGIEIELNMGQKLNYKICGDQARKRLGIEKIIGEFKRFKKMMRQDVAD
ncbi:MAG: hypothetical protein J6U21_14510 [Bacteroidales bacterium]|nr:hypothetical protein [Bacteroidales bacterium]